MKPKNKTVLLALTALFVFTIAFAGCELGIGDRINLNRNTIVGTWAMNMGHNVVLEGTFRSDRSFQSSYIVGGVRHLAERGTYSISGNNLTMIATHVHGSGFNLVLGFPILSHQWFDRNELISTFQGLGFTLDLATLDSAFASRTAPFSISNSGNTLTITRPDRIEVHTRQ